ncbi:MAG: hypothetical protein KHZ27_01515 [Fusobacterium sp.]|nr:hypothetical protein [Fusobacterium sp.]
MKNNEHKVRIEDDFAILEYCYGENKLNGTFEICEKLILTEIRGSYKDGELNGIYELYHGNKKLIVCHYQNGKLNGMYEEYYEGKVLERCFYKDDILDGSYEIYDMYGNTKIRFNYVNGFSDGLYKIYNEYGEMLSEGLFSEIENINIVKEFYLNGYLKEVKIKNSGGPYQSYYPSGKLKIRGTLYSRRNINFERFKNCYEEYYETGNIKIKCEYKRGELHGQYEEYYETGEIKVKCNYENGEKVGLYREYDKNKKIIKEEFYEFLDRKLFSDGHFAIKSLSADLKEKWYYIY